MDVLKFGGSSVGSSDSIRQVGQILQNRKSNFVVVVSAVSGVTNQLKQIAQQAQNGQHQNELENLKQQHFQLIEELIQIPFQNQVLIYVQKQINQLDRICKGVFMLQELSEKTRAKIMSFGEQLSSFLIYHYLKQEGIPIELINGLSMIKANHSYDNAQVDFGKTKQTILQTINYSTNFIAPGFIATNPENETVLLGRGGSDYTAAIYAGVLKANQLEIWSDVDGMLNANPKLVKHAQTIEQLSYKEAFELSHFGAKVLFPPTIQPAMQESIPIFLKNTFSPDKDGTFIGTDPQESVSSIKGISSIQEVNILTISGTGLTGKKGTARRVFQALENADCNVVLITQCCSEQNICIGIHQQDVSKATESLCKEFEREIDKGFIQPVKSNDDLSIIALVGDNMRHRVGLSGKALSTLGENGINVIAIAQGASERNISIVINKVDEKKAMNVLHEQFFNHSRKTVHLFIAGIGNVGKAFVNILRQQCAQLKSDFQLEVKIVGIATSQQYLLNEDGISFEDIDQYKAIAQQLETFESFIAKMQALNLRNSVFIDNTASEEVSNFYSPILQQSISIVACNKIACSSPFQRYNDLLNKAHHHNVQFKYETCVGAALPVIKTIQDLRQSGDTIHKIEAVLSGSLNFIFNAYDATSSFASIVQKAKEEGYTEPNPLLDLGGTDVRRKILILAREAGYALEFEEVECQRFLPDSCFEVQPQELSKELEQHESYFKKLYQNAASQGKKLKVVATMENGKAVVALREIASDSPLYHLEGKDNIVSITSARYPVEPLVIKGAGAGADVTASGVFSDLMLIINR